MIICNFCESVFKNNRCYKQHLSTAKYCLKIQVNKGMKVNIDNFICSTCDKKFSRKTILKKHIESIMFSNYSRPGNNINNSLPKSMISATSNKTFGSSVVPPTSVGNTYSHVNYNRRPQGGQRKRKTRKTKRRNRK